MKKVLVIAILISYSIASFGVSFNYFYCCGKLKTVSLAVNADEKCQEGNSKKGCCENKTVIVKLKTDQKVDKGVVFNLDAPSSLAVIYMEDCSRLAHSSVSTQVPLYKRSPHLNLPSRNILFCVFRI